MNAPLISTDRRVRLGIFDAPVSRVNHADFDLRDPFGKPLGRLARRFAFNQFQFIGVLHEGAVVGCAVVDVGYLSTAFAYVFEPASGKLTTHSAKAPLSWGTRQDLSPESGRAVFELMGARLSIVAEGGRRVVQGRLGALSFDLALADAGGDPMRICTRAGPNGWVFTRKAAGAPVTGSVTVDGRAIDLSGGGGVSDWSAGYMRRETFWQWGAMAGTLADGRRVGLNVACGVNETSFTENCFWVDGVRHKLDMVHFEHHPTDLERPWRMTSFDGRMDLEFTPEGRHAEKINALVVASNFTQLYGRFSGRLTTAGGEDVILDGHLGFAEDHFARW